MLHCIKTFKSYCFTGWPGVFYPNALPTTQALLLYETHSNHLLFRRLCITRSVGCKSTASSSNYTFVLWCSDLPKDGVSSSLSTEGQDLMREEAQKMSSVLPTMWLGAQNGWWVGGLCAARLQVFIHAYINLRVWCVPVCTSTPLWLSGRSAYTPSSWRTLCSASCKHAGRFATSPKFLSFWWVGIKKKNVCFFSTGMWKVVSWWDSLMAPSPFSTEELVRRNQQRESAWYGISV